MLQQRKLCSTVQVLVFVCLNMALLVDSKTCPLGFHTATHKKNGDRLCYRLKPREYFDDKFVGCTGNLFSVDTYFDYDFEKKNVTIWAELKSAYPGGRFVDHPYTSFKGNALEDADYIYDPKYTKDFGIEEELCVTINSLGGLRIVRCEGKHYRYCFVKPYPSDYDKSEGCEELPDFTWFPSPRPTCLRSLNNVRATWQQAQELCERKKSSMLHRGWRYTDIVEQDPDKKKPLGVFTNEDLSLHWYTAEDGSDDVPESEWSFGPELYKKDTLIALEGQRWIFVNNTVIFYEVICERSIHLQAMVMNVSLDLSGRLILVANDSIEEDNIKCFTDSTNSFPQLAKFTRVDDKNTFVLKPREDGYYWCTNTDSTTHLISQSNKALFIRNKQSLQETYALKIRFRKKYDFNNLSTILRIWERKLADYIFYRTKYISVYGDSKLDDPYKSQDVLKKFRDTMPQWKEKEKNVFVKVVEKRVYLDRRTILLHVELNQNMELLPPGHWEDIEVIFMKPVYYCKAFDNIPQLALGESIDNCRKHSCVGDFNEGVQWLTTAGTCQDRGVETLTKAVTVNYPIQRSSQVSENQDDSSDSSEEANTSTTEPCTEETTEAVTTRQVTVYTTVTPSTVVTAEPIIPPRPPPPPITTTPVPTSPAPRPPSEQLQQVLEGLEQLLDTSENEFLQVENILTAFDQVDELLDLQDEELGIPGQLLHMLDEVGARVNLNGSQFLTTVRSNIALVMADSNPDNPIRGLRIATRDNDTFTDEAFEIIKEDLNSSILSYASSEAVVQLPDSVFNSSRRISFVVFRNDRAFQSGDLNSYLCNSRVLSIKIENLTQFAEGEVIDIHLSPTGDANRNQTRTCGYWQFQDDNTGAWAHDGCTFIAATNPGQLDTCRCTHLTHFAEILVPRTVFDQKHEDILEYLSISGCCLSLLGLSLIGLTALMFSSWRRDFSNKIWLQLCIAILVLVVCFLIVVFSKFDSYTVACMLTGVALHYSVLASFCWMLVAAVLSYRRLVLVFTRDASHKLLRAAAFAWGAPCAVIGILLSAYPHAYEGNFEDLTPSGAFCYPSGLSLWLAVYTPVSLMLLANWVLFVLIVRSVFASRRIQRHGDSNEALRCASVSCLLVFLFGLPWIIGLFAFNVVAAYFFTLTTTLQGFVLFIFFVLGNKKTRDLWLNKLKIKQTRKVPVTSSTYTNKSSGANWRGGPPGPSTIEANSSKPRSLSSPDDRFS